MIFLDRKLSLTLFCLLRQGWRSVDHSLIEGSDGWMGLKLYYYTERAQQIEGVIKMLYQSSEYNSDTYNIKLKSEVKKQNFHFQTEEIAYIKSCLTDFLRMLEEENPSIQEKVVLRSELGDCWGLVSSRCEEFSKSEKAMWIENFLQPTWRQHYSIEDVLHPD